jgi:integrator complex subunit 9
MLALPFITEYSKFKGKIYATEPTIQIGRQFMEELIQYDSSATLKDNPMWQTTDAIQTLPFTLADKLKGATKWRWLYTKSDVNSCISKIQSVSYSEDIVRIICCTCKRFTWKLRQLVIYILTYYVRKFTLS